MECSTESVFHFPPLRSPLLSFLYILYLFFFLYTFENVQIVRYPNRSSNYRCLNRKIEPQREFYFIFVKHNKLGNYYYYSGTRRESFLKVADTRKENVSLVVAFYAFLCADG